MTDNTELKRLAEAATAGPWSMCGEADGSQGFEIVQDIWNEHGTHTGMDVVVYEWSYESDPLGVIHRADAEFIAAANPVAVLALIADSNRLESEAVYAAAGFNAACEEIAKIHAEVAGLRTGYEAYEQVNAELKAEVEGLREANDKLTRRNGMLEQNVEVMTEAYVLYTWLRKKCDQPSNDQVAVQMNIGHDWVPVHDLDRDLRTMIDREEP